MPSKHTSPYASTFKSAINRGTPCSVAVMNIASRTKKSPSVIFNSLFKAGFVHRQKVGGSWVFWPCHWPKKKGSSMNIKTCQTNMWQWFVDWCLLNGFCTPHTLHNHCGSQQEFMGWCKKFWGRQVAGTGAKKTTSRKRKASTPRAGKPKTAKRSKRRVAPKSYKFPGVRSRTSKRFRTAA